MTPGGESCGPESVCVIAAVEGSAAVALDDNNVFFYNAGTLRAVPKTGGIAKTIASGLKKYPSGDRMFVDDANVYVLEGSDTAGQVVDVMRIPKTGGTGDVLLPASENVWAFGIDDTSVYWSSGSVAALKTMPKVGGSTKSLSPNTGFSDSRSVVVNGGYAHWVAADGSISRLATNVTTPTAPDTISTGVRAEGIAADQNAIYFTVNASPGGVWSVPFATGTATKLTDSSFAQAIAVNSANVYWSASNAISRMPKGGGPVTSVAAEFASTILADDTYVFWVGSKGLMRAPK